MIIVRIRGGLGNQLFQYAAAKALATCHNTQVKLDLYYFKKHAYRSFDLDKFQIAFEVAARKEVHEFTGSNPLIRYINKRENYFHCPKVVVQPYYHFYDDFFKLPGHIYLSGYWQSEKYFEPIKHNIRQWVQPANELDGLSRELADEMANGESVSLHVRRGDYTSSIYNTFFGGLTENYYKKAIQKIIEHVHNPKFFIFSDDISWCRNNLSVPDATFVDHNKGSASYKDLFLMSRCRHNIIANSSFSWWSAWLNSNTAKIVIAPGRWFKKQYSDGPQAVYPCRIYNTKDLLPTDWIQINQE